MGSPWALFVRAGGSSDSRALLVLGVVELCCVQVLRNFVFSNPATDVAGHAAGWLAVCLVVERGRWCHECGLTFSLVRLLLDPQAWVKAFRDFDLCSVRGNMHPGRSATFFKTPVVGMFREPL